MANGAIVDAMKLYQLENIFSVNNAVVNYSNALGHVHRWSLFASLVFVA